MTTFNTSNTPNPLNKTTKASGLPFADLVQNIRSNNEEPTHPYTGYLVCFDPGETTGIAVFKGLELIEARQINTKVLETATTTTAQIIQRYNVLAEEEAVDIHIVIEDYKVYSWKADEHSWANLHTAKYIGVIIAIASLEQLFCTMQMAQQGKGFCTDDKLQKWGFYRKGQRHARDAIRHGCHFHLFGKNPKTRNDLYFKPIKPNPLK